MVEDMSDVRLTRIALVIVCATVFLLAWFQVTILVQARDNLQKLHSNQEQPTADATKLRVRAEGLAKRTAKLADEGNVNAKAIIENLRRQGVEIKSTEPPKIAPQP